MTGFGIVAKFGILERKERAMKRFEFRQGGLQPQFADGDCMARAMAVVTAGEIPYMKAREFCTQTILDAPIDGDVQLWVAKAAADAGSLPIGTPITRLFLERMAHKGFSNHIDFGRERYGWLEDLPSIGRNWLVVLQDHASAFCNGVVIDQADWQDRATYRRNGLYHAWEWKP